MAKVFLICGKICSGKTVYSKKLAKKYNAVLLSCDELDYFVFHHSLGENHDVVMARVQNFLHKKAIDILSVGSNVVLDWGFWSKANRDEVSKFYRSNNIPLEWHYIDVSEEQWKRNIESRNKDVNAGETTDYYVDQGLLNKLNSIFEKPDEREMNVWFVNKGM